MAGPGPYRNWPTERQSRWIRAANLFGRHLLREWEGALNQVPANASEDARTAARAAGLALLHGMLSMLDGIPSLETDDGYRVEYVLLTRFQERQASGDFATVEAIELAPGGDGLRYGLSGWLRGDFDAGHDPAEPPRFGPEQARVQQENARRERVQRKREDIERRSAAGPPCPFCGKPLRTAKAQQCFHCGRSWRENA